MTYLHRIYNVVWLAALVYAFLQLGFSPVPDCKAWLFAFLGLIAFRYIVRLPIVRS